MLYYPIWKHDIKNSWWNSKLPPHKYWFRHNTEYVCVLLVPKHLHVHIKPFLGEENVVTRDEFENVLKKGRHEIVAEEGKFCLQSIYIMINLLGNHLYCA